MQHPIAKYSEVAIESLAYIGTGNVLKVQKLLQMCVENLKNANNMH